MLLTGLNYIGFSLSEKTANTFQAFNPASNMDLPEKFSLATDLELLKAISLAENAFKIYRDTSSSAKADFLDAIATEILALGDSLIERCASETGLTIARLTGERQRTCGQLKLFAQLLRDGWWVDARIDTAISNRSPARPDIRRMLIPIGPVAVFGASNFPLAFSTAGGDTASALAAGCPVIVKAHPSHPGTNEMVASAIIKAAQKSEMPEGVFSSLQLSNEDALKLVAHPSIKAVGFTGSRNAGMILYHAAAKRPEPIPVYAEMSSVNPVILLEGALKTNRDAIARDLANSLALGAGQFCTNPGLVLTLDNEDGQSFLRSFSAELSKLKPATMLNKNIYDAYIQRTDKLKDNKEIATITNFPQEASPERYEAQPSAFVVGAGDYMADKQLGEEVFGPSTLIILNKDSEQLTEVLHSLEGQLTVTVHATDADEGRMKAVVDIITQKAGRIIYGGYPTGVEVSHSMQHGGPFPSTTDPRSTSVGTAAIYRFVRPVTFQEFPDHLLPEALQNKNPLHIMRLVDGKWNNSPIEPR